MTHNEILKAYKFAQFAHRGQKDDSDRDYFYSHVSVVAEIVRVLIENSDEDMVYGRRQFTDLEIDTICAAYLHDTLEDTSTTYEELVKEFGVRVADLVHELTHEGSKEEGYYFPRLKSKEAILIKLCDRASNISRMDAWDEKRQEHYLKKTKFWKSEA